MGFPLVIRPAYTMGGIGGGHVYNMEEFAMADSFPQAFFKAQEAVQQTLPTSGTVLITVAERDKKSILEAAQEFINIDFAIRATEGTWVVN
ncbi:MAG: hypothetical protein QM498_09070 [Desulfobacterium sp.]